MSRWWVDRSRDVPTFDLASYHNRVVDLVHMLGHQPFEALHQMGYSVFHSTSFTDLYAVPFIPLVAIFGNSRSTFIELSTVIGMVPFALMIGALVGAIVPEHPTRARWCGIGGAFASAPMWFTALAGWPDLLAVDALLLATLLWTRDPGATRLRVRLGVPVLLATCIVLRRYYLIEVIVLVAVMAAGSLLGLGRAEAARAADDRLGWRGRAWRWFRAPGRIGAALLPAVVTAVVLLGVSPGYVREAHNIRASGLYVSYESPPRVIFTNFVRAWGVATLVVAVIGLALGIAAGLRRAPRAWIAAAVAAQGVGALAGWTFFGRELEVHYMTQIAIAVAVGLGLAAFMLIGLAVPAPIEHDPTRGRSGRQWVSGARMAAVVTVLVVVATVPHFTAGSAYSPIGYKLRPPVRSDLPVLGSVVDRLRGLAASGPVLVASSGLFNATILQALERDRYGAAGMRVAYVQEPQVDSADRWPDQAVFSAGLVVLADPVPLDLRADQERVVTSVEDLFHRGVGAATDFRRLPGAYRLEDGSTVTLYRRWRATTLARAEATLAAVRVETIHRPGRQPAWDVLGDDPAVDLSEGPPGGVLTGTVRAPSAAAPLTFFTVDAVPAGQRLSVELSWPRRCAVGPLEIRAFPLGPSTSALVQPVGGGVTGTVGGGVPLAPSVPEVVTSVAVGAVSSRVRSAKVAFEVSSVARRSPAGGCVLTFRLERSRSR